MTIKVRIVLDAVTLALIEKHEAALQRALEQYPLTKKAEIDAESHLIDAGLIEPTARHYLMRAWLKQREDGNE